MDDRPLRRGYFARNGAAAVTDVCGLIYVEPTFSGWQVENDTRIAIGVCFNNIANFGAFWQFDMLRNAAGTV